MITVQLRQNVKGNWWCNATIKGFDHSFEGSFIAVIFQMAGLLKQQDIAEDEVIWEDPKLYPHKEPAPKNNISYGSWRIDKGMV